MMVGHTNAGASDLDKAYIGYHDITSALENSLHPRPQRPRVAMKTI